MNLNCLIIDDEQPARALIRAYVDKIPTLTVIGEFKNPLDAIQAISHHQVDLIFLDIQMPGLTGLEFIKTLQNQPHIVLTTAYSEYALEGYDLNVIDYLMKPITFERFLKAFNKVVAKGQGKSSSHEQNDNLSNILIKSEGQIHRIPLADILYIEGLREYVTFHLKSRKLITLDSLKKLESELPASTFLRVHKSFIVNKEKIGSHSGHDLTIDSKKIPIGASYRDAVLSKLF